MWPTMHKTIGVYNNKGGVGKTMTTSHLAWYAEYQEIKTIAVCIDNQGDLYRILTRGDGTMKEGTFHERSPFLSVVFSPKKVPKFTNVDLVLVDCSPAIEVALSFSPSLWLVPIHGRLAFENMHNVLGELEASASEVLILKNMAGRGGKRMDHELSKAIAAIPKAKVCDVVVPEADAITRTTDFFKPVWEVPYGSGTNAAAVIESMCRSVLTAAGFKMKKRRINAEEE
jgi:cellulose biosynthesis protein BcsQ